MSNSVFSQFFKRNTGHGFVRYVNRMRINRACMLLTKTEMPVTDICFETGFNNISNFNRQFRAFCGLTPSEYRREGKRNIKQSTELYKLGDRAADGGAGGADFDLKPVDPPSPAVREIALLLAPDVPAAIVCTNQRPDLNRQMAAVIVAGVFEMS